MRPDNGETATSDRALVIVHGHHFKPAAEPLMSLCRAGLLAGLERDHPECVERFVALGTRLAYYGDIGNRCLASHGMSYDERLDVGDRVNVLAELRALRRKHFSLARYDRLPGKSALGEFAADTLAPVMARLGLSERVVTWVGVDVSEYWRTDGDFAEQVRGRVRAVIAEVFGEGRELLLISHGTGAIVSYDALWQLSHDPTHAAVSGRKVDLWLTLGAPLGDAMVARRLLGARESGAARYPTNIVSWHNVAAEDDYLSHDKAIADDFAPMLERRLLSTIRDHRIYNLAVRYGRSNPHHSLGYLIHPCTSRIVAEWLAREPPVTAG